MNEPASDAKIAALVTTVSVHSDDHFKVRSWLVKTVMKSCDTAGFLNAEILPPDNPANGDWTLVQKFRSAASRDKWKASQPQQELLQALSSAEAGAQIKQEEVAQYGSRGSVATAIVTNVLPGMESAYRDWECKIQTEQASFPGYCGAYIQPPTDSYGQWMTLLRFDKPETLDSWFNSPTRKQLLDEATKLVKSTDIRNVTNSFPGWVPVDEKTGKGPPNWKTFLLVLLGLYPIVMLEIRFLNPMLHSVPSAPANFIGNILSVAATTWLTMPLFIQLFKWWLFPAEDTWLNDAKGLAVLIICFAVEIAGLWNLLSH